MEIKLNVSLKNVLLTVGILLVFIISIYMTYKTAYDKGMTDSLNIGYDFGFSSGQNATVNNIVNQMCIQSKTFSCPNSTKICGCFLPAGGQ